MPAFLSPSRPGTAVVPKAEAIQKIAKHIAASKALLEELQARMRGTVKPGRYALNFEINALKKEIHHWKIQAERIQREPRTEVPIPEDLGS